MMADDGASKEVREAADVTEQEAHDHMSGEAAADTSTDADASTAVEDGGDVLAWATGMVKERPMLALLGAAAAGYALALLLHGGRR